MCQSVPPFPFSEPEYTCAGASLPVETHNPPGEPTPRMKLYWQIAIGPRHVSTQFYHHGGCCSDGTHPCVLLGLHRPDALSARDELQRVCDTVLTCVRGGRGGISTV